MKHSSMFIFLILSFVLAGASPVLAMNCETPPFITRVVMPNILIILDHSGSMLDDDAGSPYDPNRKYEPWVGMPDRGNYDNWYYYNRTRWQIAKNVVTHIIDETENVRFGLIRLDGSDSAGRSSKWDWKDPKTGKGFRTDSNFKRHGGKLLRPVGTDKKELIDYINGMEVYDTVPHTYTVLAETLFTAAQYFAGGKGPPELGEYKGGGESNYTYYSGRTGYSARETDDYGNRIDTSSPIQWWCQKNFVIFMTDGESNCDSDWDQLLKAVGDYDGDGKDTPHAKPDFPDWDDRELHNYLDDVAQWMYERDLRTDMEGPDGEIQNVITYTIGFRIDMKLLQEAGTQGGGLYFTADNYDQLKEAFENALADIIKKTSSGTAASIISTAQQAQNKLFRAKFDPENWGGFIEAFSLPFDSRNPNPAWEGTADGPSSLRHRSPDSRRIYTVLDDEPGDGVRMTRRVEFIPANADTTDADNTPLYQLLGLSKRAEAEELIRYVRGEDLDKFRARKYRLGDIVYSTPAVTKDAIYVGSNDGMVHAFDIDTGMELWAFIPNNLLKKLKDLARKDYCHEYFVDLSPMVARILTGTESRIVLICGERGGGDAYFAVDVTGGDPIPMWEFREGELGESWSIPFLGRVKAGAGGGTLAAFFGSGFENNDSKGNLYAIDVGEGTVIRRVQLTDPPSDPLNSPTAVDSNDDGFLDLVYTGDLGGRVFKVTVDSDPANWSKRLLFTGLSGQPISIPVSMTFYDLDPSHLLVYFGTGKFYTLDDRLDTTIQSFYALKDDGKPVTRGSLTNQTSACSSAADSQGWYIDFIENSGERVTASPLVAGGIVFFTTFEPDIEDPCKCGGLARLYAVQYDTGCPPDSPVVDVNGDGVVDEGDKISGAVPRSIIIGHGLPSDIIFNPADNQIIIQTGDTVVHDIGVRLPGERIKIHTWRQMFR
jgi:type IV pilus assembly protein PilY1